MTAMPLETDPTPSFSSILHTQRTTQRITMETTLQGRYAKALFSKLLEDGVLKPGRSFFKQGTDFLEHYKKVLDLLTHHAPVLNALEHPAIPLSVRLSLMHKITDSLETPALLQTFLQLIVKRKRLKFVHTIYDCLHTMILHTAGHLPVQYVCATKCTSKTLKNIQTWLQQSLDHAASHAPTLTIDMQHHTNPSLISGYRIEFPEYILDASFAQQLVLLRRQALGGIS